MVRPLVSVSYEQLQDPRADLSGAIEAAFGPEGLGIILVDGVPGYVEKRAALLPLASRLAALPSEALAAMEDPASHWNFGWSHGQERLEGGRSGACSQKRGSASCSARPRCADARPRTRLRHV
jgi:hypothetical protein